jgi:hypothetical protein
MAQPAVNGSVIDQVTGLGFGNVLVLWTSSGRHKATLGSARTAADGTFSITLANTVEARETACRLQFDPSLATQVTIAIDAAHPIGQPVAVSPDQTDVTIALQPAARVRARPNGRQWRHGSTVTARFACPIWRDSW